MSSDSPVLSKKEFREETEEALLREMDADSSLEAYLKIAKWDPEAPTGLELLKRVYIRPERDTGTLTTRERLRRQAIFLTLYSQSGNVSQSGYVAGVNIRAIEFWKETYPHFKEAFEQARELYNDTIRAEIHRRAITGWLEPVYYKGELIDHVRKYSDSLLIHLSKAKMPEEFQDRSKVEVGGQIGLVPWAPASPEDLPEGRQVTELELPSPTDTDRSAELELDQLKATDTPSGHAAKATRKHSKMLPVLRVSYTPPQDTIDGEFTETPIENVAGDDTSSNEDQRPLRFEDFK